MDTRRSQTHRILLAAAVMVAAAAAALAPGCNKGDKIAPEGSTIDLAANPTTIPTAENPVCLGLLGVDKCGTSVILATVSSAAGAPLPDQDVRFTSTAGVLFQGTLDNPEPVANLPIETDEFGNARVSLVTSATTTVTARSGQANGNLTLNTIQGNLSSITLEFDTESPGCSPDAPDVNTCSDEICLIATALDNDGVGIPNLVIQFRLQNNDTDGATFNGSFSPAQPPTDADGVATTVLRPSVDCPSECGELKCISAEVVAFTQGGFQSLPQTLNIVIQ